MEIAPWNSRGKQKIVREKKLYNGRENGTAREGEEKRDKHEGKGDDYQRSITQQNWSYRKYVILRSKY